VAKGEFVAIFDADFVPPPDWLMKVIHHFAEPEIGMVQTRWTHLNRDYSMLTQIEAILLDGHFVLEHGARARSGEFFNFNGTAGMWRARPSTTAAAGSTTRSLKIPTSATAPRWPAGSSSTCPTSSALPSCPSR
jgi:hypothetical protein